MMSEMQHDQDKHWQFEYKPDDKVITPSFNPEDSLVSRLREELKDWR